PPEPQARPVPETPRETGRRGGARVARPAAGGDTPSSEAPARVERPNTDRPSDDWRGRVSRGGYTPRPADTPSATEPRATAPADRPSDIPRRIIDRIGGARSRPADSTPPPSRSSGESGSSGRSHGDSGGSSTRSAPPPQPQPASPPPQRSHEDGGKVKHDQ